MDYFFFLLTVVLTFPFAHYITQYTGWKYPEFHQDDLEKAYAYGALILCCLILTVVGMAQS